MTPEIIKRQRAAQACVDRFNGLPYKPGQRDCARLFKLALNKMGRKVDRLKGVTYTTEAGAYKQLKKQGFDDLVAAVDALGLTRIAPAMALPADIIAIPAEEGDPFKVGLGVAVGNGRVFGFSGGLGGVFQPKEYACAWRV